MQYFSTPLTVSRMEIVVNVATATRRAQPLYSTEPMEYDFILGFVLEESTLRSLAKTAKKKHFQ